MEKLERLSEKIWKRGEPRSENRVLTPELIAEVEQVNIKDLLIFAFTHYLTASVSDFFLMLSPFWLKLDYKDWLQVFEGIQGEPLGEYHMAVIAARYLGLDPKFASTKDVEIGEITFQDNKMHSGKPAAFVGETQGRLRQIYQEELQKGGLSIDVLFEYAERMSKHAAEKNKVRKPKLENTE